MKMMAKPRLILIPGNEDRAPRGTGMPAGACATKANQSTPHVT